MDLNKAAQALREKAVEQSLGELTTHRTWDDLSYSDKHKWVMLAIAAADVLVGPCTCDTSPNSDGPEETCPQDGRPIEDLWGIIQRQRQELNKIVTAVGAVPATGYGVGNLEDRPGSAASY